MAENCSLNYEVRIDTEAFDAAVMKRLALTSGTPENYERIALELIGDFIIVERDILADEFLH